MSSQKFILNFRLKICLAKNFKGYSQYLDFFLNLRLQICKWLNVIQSSYPNKHTSMENVYIQFSDDVYLSFQKWTLMIYCIVHCHKQQTNFLKKKYYINITSLTLTELPCVSC